MFGVLDIIDVIDIMFSSVCANQNANHEEEEREREKAIKSLASTIKSARSIDNNNRSSNSSIGNLRRSLTKSRVTSDR